MTRQVRGFFLFLLVAMAAGYAALRANNDALEAQVAAVKP